MSTLQIQDAINFLRPGSKSGARYFAISQDGDGSAGRRFVSIEKAAQFAKVLGYSEAQFVAMVLEDQLRTAGMPFVVELKKAA